MSDNFIRRDIVMLNETVTTGIVKIIGLIISCSFIFLFLLMFINTLFKNYKNKKKAVVFKKAIVVSKRTQTLQRKMGSTMAYRNVTRYYVSFQFENGDREEFSVSGNDFGMIAENDRGKLEYQGTKFISFFRE